MFKNRKSIILFLSILFIFVGCGKNQITSEFGSYNSINSFSSVRIELSSFKNFKELTNWIESLACNDSFPRLILENKNSKKIINLEAICLERFACVLKMQRNVIEIEDDSIYKSSKKYPIDSLSFIMNKDFNNFGKNPEFSDNPDKIRIQISVRKKPLNFIEVILDSVTNSYQNLNTKARLNLSLERMISIESIPPPPKPIN